MSIVFDVIQQMRLAVGDIDEGNQWLTDDVYEFYYEQNGNSIIDGSIEALETIINYISLSPSESSIGDVTEKMPLVNSLERRLESLKNKKYTTKTPIVVRTDRKNWDDLDELFRGYC